MLFGKPVGKTYDAVIEKLKDPENSEQLMRLQQALEL